MRMLGNIGISGLILILVAVLLVFGPSKLPEVGRAFGRGLKEFKDATRDITSSDAPPLPTARKDEQP